ncbi:MAG: glycosyltransferase [bacterium]|nr:glycosyltransferase [bacterium]
MEKTKILFVITSGGGGGAQRYVFDLATNISQNFDVVVAVGEQNGHADLQKRLQDANIRVIQLKRLVRRVSPWNDLAAIFELVALYRRERPAIVHLNSSKAGIIGSLAKLLNQLTNQPITTLIYTVHGWVFNGPMSKLHRYIYLILEKLTAKLKNKIIVLSPEDAITAKNILSIPENKLAIIPLGIEPPLLLDRTTARAELSKHTHMPDDATWVVTIANFFRTKGLDILIDAVALNKDKLNKTQFIVIGDGQNRDILEKKIADAGLTTHIHLLGFIAEAAKFLSAFDLMVIPSVKEGLPYVALEAISARLPIVATKTGGLPTLIRNEKLLATPGDARDLGQKITDALEHPSTIKTTISSLHEMIKATTVIYSL